MLHGKIIKHLRSASEYRGVEQLAARRAHNPEVVGSSPASATKNRRFHHENGGFPNFMRLKQYGSNLLTHTVTHTPKAYSGQVSTKGYPLAVTSEKSEKLLKFCL